MIAGTASGECPATPQKPVMAPQTIPRTGHHGAAKSGIVPKRWKRETDGGIEDGREWRKL